MRPLDVLVLVVYVLAVVVLGSALARRSRTLEEFTIASGSLPSWAVGLSLFGTFLSSNTFLGVPGKAYASNWNAFVFSLSLPIAAFLASRVFVPFYRRAALEHTGEISAYAHLERRFGRWARVYAMVCYLLTQLARIGSILFGVALALAALTGWPPLFIVIGTGALVTLYTLLGGIEAVIWTDVVQSIVLTAGALLVAGLLLFGMPEGPGQLFEVAGRAGRFSLGSFAPDLTSSTFWVVLIYGVFINLNNFGIDQSYVQRYHVARSEREASRSVWLAAWLYLPISLVFFFIGAGLFAHYEVHADQRRGLERAVVETWGEEHLEGATPTEQELGDRVFPHFIVNELPPGVSGLLLAALVAAAMSSIDTSLNSSATVLLSDIWNVFVSQADERRSMWVLRSGTVAMGFLGTAAGAMMLGIESVLDTWWLLSGIFAGGMLGLFLLGLLDRRAGSRSAMTGVGAGLLVILYMTLSPRLPEALASWRSPFHGNMILVLGTLTILVVGASSQWLLERRAV